MTLQICFLVAMFPLPLTIFSKWSEIKGPGDGSEGAMEKMVVFDTMEGEMLEKLPAEGFHLVDGNDLILDPVQKNGGGGDRPDGIGRC